MKVCDPTKKPVKTLLLNVESPYKIVNFFRVFSVQLLFQKFFHGSVDVEITHEITAGFSTKNRFRSS